MTEVCERRNKWIGGCSFEPRYSTSEAILPENITKMTGDLLDGFRRHTYVGEVCTRCGRFATLPETSSDAKVGADSHG